MPQFDTFDLIKWLHFASFAIGGGAAVTALLISGLEDEREEVRGLAPTIWKWVVAWGFRSAFLTGLILLTMKLTRGDHPFDDRYLHWKIALVTALLVTSELSPKNLAKARRGAPLIALLMFLLATFVVINKGAFGRIPRPASPAEVTAAP